MAREADRQHELELRKLELSQQNRPLNDESGRRVEIGPKIQLTQITTKFDEKHNEISLYLINFERKTELAQVPKKDWVAYLLAVLPAELSNMLAREPTERTSKSAEKSWRNYAHELNSYFTEWIAEFQVKTFEQLKDLLITEQLKYHVPAEIKENIFWETRLLHCLKKVKNKEIQVYMVNAVETRSQKKLTEKSKQDTNMSEETIPESNEKNKESPDELDDIFL
ncbi:SCAN box domain-containing protein [Trichonephila clavipes]|nr:SCAN box domain-containing protein [Trichonephila clavipes]